MTEEQWEKCKDYFNNKCAYCGEDTKELTRDHVLAYSKGGYNVQSNIVPACQSCNSSKRDKDMEEWYRTKNYFDNKRLEKIYNWTNVDEDIQQMALF